MHEDMAVKSNCIDQTSIEIIRGARGETSVRVAMQSGEGITWQGRPATIVDNDKQTVKHADTRQIFFFPVKNIPSMCCREKESCGHGGFCAHGLWHKTCFAVRCCEGVVYQILLTCGASYVGQTGRCLNIRLREDMSLRKSALPIWLHTVGSVATSLY